MPSFVLAERTQYGSPVLYLGPRDLIRQLGGGGPRPHGVRKDVKVGKGQLFNKLKVIVEVLRGLARKPGDKVGADSRRGHRLKNTLNPVSEMGHVVAPAHTHQRRVSAGLKRQMKMRAELVTRSHDFQNSVTQFFGVERAYPDPIDRRALGDHLEQ